MFNGFIVEYDDKCFFLVGIDIGNWMVEFFD